MKVLTPGHKYELANFEDAAGPCQSLQFIEKEPGGAGLVTVHDGTTNEEVLAMLIDRLQFLHGKIPSRETALALTKIQEALHWLGQRTADRKKRGVEGTAVA